MMIMVFVMETFVLAEQDVDYLPKDHRLDLAFAIFI
jgi:hypothetical protein